MRYISSLFSNFRPRESPQPRVRDSANLLLSEKLAWAENLLLLEGYEIDPFVRRRGPLGPTPEDWPLAFEWFGAVQMSLVRNFAASQREWNDSHELDMVLSKCNVRIVKWCVSHGANETTLHQCCEVLKEALQRFPNVFYGDGSEFTEYVHWAKDQPEIGEHWWDVRMYFTDRGLVSEYLRPLMSDYWGPNAW